MLHNSSEIRYRFCEHRVSKERIDVWYVSKFQPIQVEHYQQRAVVLATKVVSSKQWHRFVERVTSNVKMRVIDVCMLKYIRSRLLDKWTN